MATATADVIETDDVEAALLLSPEFSVYDRDSAEWLVRKVVEADAHIARVKAQAAREIRRTERERDFLLMRYGPELERWTEQQLNATQGRRKSVLLLSGTVGFRSTSAALVVSDLPTLVAWARRYCKKAVVVVKKVSKSTLKAHFEKSGELPDGMEITPAKNKFFIK